MYAQFQRAHIQKYNYYLLDYKVGENKKKYISIVTCKYIFLNFVVSMKLNI